MAENHFKDGDITPSNESQSDEFTRPMSAMSSEPSVGVRGPRDDSLLGVVFGIGMNVNNVIGSGIVTTPGIIWNRVKSPGIVMLLWVIGGIEIGRAHV